MINSYHELNLIDTFINTDIEYFYKIFGADFYLSEK